MYKESNIILTSPWENSAMRKNIWTGAVILTVAEPEV